MRLNATKLGSIANSRSFGDQLFDLAGEVPNLDLNFAGTKTLDPRVTFTRASTGTYVGSDGLIKSATTNEARFDHNPTTGESLGLLVEEARTNLITTSEALANITGGSITNNTTTAPDGLVTADTLIEDTSTGNHSVNTASIIWAGNTAYTFTFFLKANTRTQANIAFGTSSNWVNSQRNATFDLSDGTVISTAGTSVTASIEPFLNSWYRCRLTATTVAAPVPSAIQTQMYVSGSSSYTGNGTSDIFFWGAQLEAGAFPTSYIPTTTATATRAADVASITGANFSSFYNQTEGTVFADAKVTTVAPATSLTSVFALSDGTTSNRITVYKRANADTSTRLDVSTSGSSVAFINAGTFSVSNLIAASYRVNDFAISLNGLTPGTDTLGAIPTVSRLNIGNYADSTFPLNGTIKRLTYFPVRLANPTLQAIAQP